jgi:hypothetical protein
MKLQKCVTMSVFSKFKLAKTLILLILSSQVSYGQSTLVTIAEDPFATTSSLSNTNEFNFNDLETGFNYNLAWDNVGSFDQVYVRSANKYGGAIDENTGLGSNYSYVKNAYNIQNSTLTLDTPSSYFGMWWSAGDSSNLLTFYNDDQIVSQYSTASMF